MTEPDLFPIVMGCFLFAVCIISLCCICYRVGYSKGRRDELNEWLKNINLINFNFNL